MKNFKTSFIYFFLMILSLFVIKNGVAQQKEFLSIDTCYAKARQNYPIIKQFQLIEKSKEYTISNANKAYLPQFDVTIIGGVIDGFPDLSPDGSGGGLETKIIGLAQLNQVIWDGGYTKAKKEIAIAGSEVESRSLEVQLFAIRERVNQIFYGSLLIEEQVKQLKLMQENLKRSLKTVKTAYNNGTAYKSDVQEVEVEILNTEQKISEMNYSKKAYLAMLEVLIGEPIAGWQLQKPNQEVSLTVPENRRPELMMFQSQQQVLNAQSKMINASLYPKFGLMGVGAFFSPEISFGQAGIDHIIIGGLSLSWNIGGFYTKSNEKNLLQIKSQGIDVQKEAFLFSNDIQLSQQSNELQKYHSMLERDRALLELKSSIRKSYEVKYDNGVCTLTDLLARMNEENLAKQTLIFHEVQYQMAISEINYLQGK